MLRRLKTNARQFLRDETGATAIEYGLIAALISVAIITAATKLGTNIANTFNNVSDNMKHDAMAETLSRHSWRRQRMPAQAPLLCAGFFTENREDTFRKSCFECPVFRLPTKYEMQPQSSRPRRRPATTNLD